MRDLGDNNDDSPLWKHCVAHHGGKEQVFKMKLLSTHTTAFDRQMSEAVNITYGERDIILNSKSEWMGSSLPRLTVEVKDKVKIVDHDGTKMQPPVTNSKRTRGEVGPALMPPKPTKGPRKPPLPPPALYPRTQIHTRGTRGSSQRGQLLPQLLLLVTGVIPQAHHHQVQHDRC